jgi:hypothetical protein
MIAVLHDSHPMLVCSVTNERPTVYTAMVKIPISAASLHVKGPRRGTDSPANGTLRII